MPEPVTTPLEAITIFLLWLLTTVVTIKYMNVVKSLSEAEKMEWSLELKEKYKLSDEKIKKLNFYSGLDTIIGFVLVPIITIINNIIVLFSSNSKIYMPIRFSYGFFYPLLFISCYEPKSTIKFSSYKNFEENIKKYFIDLEELNEKTFTKEFLKLSESERELILKKYIEESLELGKRHGVEPKPKK